MKTITIRHRCNDYHSYRAARVKSLFNAESGCCFDLDATLDLSGDWSIGVVVGPSGSGKTSIGNQLFEGIKVYNQAHWPHDAPIIDAIAPSGDFDAVTSALASVGLGSVPAWLRPYAVLSTGEKFRADLARLICEAPDQVVIDEFTSVVDRQIARFGAAAFQKAWRRTQGQCVLLSCHYDILDWIEPDWLFDTGTGSFTRGRLRRRPTFNLDIHKTDSHYWRYFEPHYYLKLPKMIAAEYFVGTVDGELVAHLAVSPMLQIGGVRASRMVVMPEWQGAGIGLRFLEAVLHWYIAGHSRYDQRVNVGLFHTSHPALCQALRSRQGWLQISARLYGQKSSGTISGKYGSHFRAVQGFRYYGKASA